MSRLFQEIQQSAVACEICNDGTLALHITVDELLEIPVPLCDVKECIVIVEEGEL